MIDKNVSAYPCYDILHDNTDKLSGLLKCDKCNRMSVIKRGNIRLCEKYYRFLQNNWLNKNRSKQNKWQE